MRRWAYAVSYALLLASVSFGTGLVLDTAFGKGHIFHAIVDGHSGCVEGNSVEKFYGYERHDGGPSILVSINVRTCVDGIAVEPYDEVDVIEGDTLTIYKYPHVEPDVRVIPRGPSHEFDERVNDGVVLGARRGVEP